MRSDTHSPFPGGSERTRQAVKKAYPFTFYFLYFAALACLAPFVVLFYQQLGFSGAQIGLLAGMAPLITLV